MTCDSDLLAVARIREYLGYMQETTKCPDATLPVRVGDLQVLLRLHEEWEVTESLYMAISEEAQDLRARCEARYIDMKDAKKERDAARAKLAAEESAHEELHKQLSEMVQAQLAEMARPSDLDAVRKDLEEAVGLVTRAKLLLPALASDGEGTIQVSASWSRDTMLKIHTDIAVFLARLEGVTP